MPMGILFWVLMLIWLIFGLIGYNYDGPNRGRILGGWGLLTFILFVLVGWKLFGAPLQ